MVYDYNWSYSIESTSVKKTRTPRQPTATTGHHGPRHGGLPHTRCALAVASRARGTHNSHELIQTTFMLSAVFILRILVRMEMRIQNPAHAHRF